MSSSNTTIPDEHALLRQVSAGDEEAFRRVYDYYRPRIFSFALKILKCEESAEDIVHEVFLRIWQHESLEKVESLGGYIHVIARNCVLKALRRLQLQAIANSSYASARGESCDDTEQTVLWKDAERLLQQAINNLPPQQKMVFRLCREEGMKYEEVAERMAISRLTVKTHMQHALRYLRTYINTHRDAAMTLFLLLMLREK